MQGNNFLGFRLTVKIDLFEEIYYLKQVFHLLFFFISFTVKIHLVEAAYYLKQVFHLLYDETVTPEEVLLYFFYIL